MRATRLVFLSGFYLYSKIKSTHPSNCFESDLPEMAGIGPLGPGESLVLHRVCRRLGPRIGWPRWGTTSATLRVPSWVEVGSHGVSEDIK